MAREIFLVVAALLLTGLASVAVAAEEKKQSSKGAAKALAILQMLGLQDSRIKSLIAEADKHIEGRYVRIAEENWDDNRIVLHYRMGVKMGMRQLQLQYTPEPKSRFSVTASTAGVMINYRFELK